MGVQNFFFFLRGVGWMVTKPPSIGEGKKKLKFETKKKAFLDRGGGVRWVGECGEG